MVTAMSPASRSRTEPTVAVQVLKALLGRAAALGVPAVAQRVSVDAAVLEDVDGRVPAAIVRALWDELPRASRDDWFGLNLAERVPDASLGIVAYVVQHAPTLGQGFVASVRYARLLQDVAACFVEPTSNGGLRFVQEPLAGNPVPPRHAVEFAFARAVLMARRSTGVPIVPQAVRFAFARPVAVDRYAELFGSNLTFAGTRNELELDAATLALPQREADPWLRDLVEQRARALLEKLGPAGSFSSGVAVVVGRAIQRGSVELEAVARELKVGSRTLQRRLADEGRTFRAVVEQARHELAKQYLADRGQSLAQVALLLGFSEQAAFHRAFVRWTGMTPGQFRREAAAPRPA
jgi:AraC-like DNA-binding protein